MLDSLYTPDTRERAAAEAILEAASRGRTPNASTIAGRVRLERSAVVAVWARLHEAGLVSAPPRGRGEG